MVCFLDLLFDCNSRSGIIIIFVLSRRFAGVNSQNFIYLACYGVQLVEEIKPNISVVSECSGFGLVGSYDALLGFWYYFELLMNYNELFI